MVKPFLTFFGKFWWSSNKEAIFCSVGLGVWDTASDLLGLELEVGLALAASTLPCHLARVRDRRTM